MAYIPKSKYTKKHTNGGEFVVASTGKAYIGYYLELSNRTYFAGTEPQNITEELKPFTPSSQNIPRNKANVVFEVLNPTYVQKERKYKSPVATKNFPTEKDYTNGSFTRYFLYRRITGDYIEVDEKTYQNARNGTTIDNLLYTPGQITWALKGNTSQINTNNLIRLEEIFPKLSSLFPNLTEFASQE